MPADRLALGLGALLAIVVLTSCGDSTTSTGPPPNPAPALTSLAPSGELAGGGGFPLTVSGSGFIASSAVEWNGSSRVTTFINSSQVLATIPSSDLSMAGSASVTVVNPAPGGGASNALAVTISPQAPPDTGVVQIISVAMDGSPSNGNSDLGSAPSISATGRFVAFQSTGTDLVPGPASGFADIYVRDTCIGAPAGCVPATIRVSVDSNGNLANGNSRSPAISGDGRYVAFDSSSTNLVPGDTQINGMADVFLRDTCTGAPAGCVPSTIRLSVTPGGTQADGDSRRPSISASGRFVAFNSTATNLVAGGTNGQIDVFVRDTCVAALPGCTPTTSLISVATDGTQGNNASFLASISADGRFVAFQSGATNFVPGDAQNQTQVFVRDTCVGAPSGCMPSTIQVSVGTGGSLANASSGAAAISGTGRFVTFGSAATNLASGNTNGFGQAYVHDTCVGAPAGCTPSTSMASVSFNGTPPNEGGGDASISADGRFIAFDSLASNNSVLGNPSPESVFVRDTCVGAPAGCVPVNFVVSVFQGTLQENGISTFPSLSADGHYVAFPSAATNLVPGGSNGNVQVFLAKTGF